MSRFTNKSHVCQPTTSTVVEVGVQLQKYSARNCMICQDLQWMFSNSPAHGVGGGGGTFPKISFCSELDEMSTSAQNSMCMGWGLVGSIMKKKRFLLGIE